MFNTWTTIFRARAAQADEDLADRNALLILGQHLRDAAQALDASRRALAIAAAQDATQRKRLSDLCARIADLEARAVAALRDGAEDLAGRAAEAIADLETERMAAEADGAKFAAEAARLAGIVKAADRRLAALRRGKQSAEAAEAVRRLRASAVDRTAGPGALAMAEAVLERLRRAQEEAETAERAFEDLAPVEPDDAISRAMDEAGYCSKTRPTAAAVLDRLKRASEARD